MYAIEVDIGLVRILPDPHPCLFCCITDQPNPFTTDIASKSQREQLQVSLLREPLGFHGGNI